MMPTVLRAMTILLGYVYPAFECFKSIERQRPDMESLLFWCRYWIILAVLTSVERVGDASISWLPMYAEAKLAFIVYLWYPGTKGTTYVYSTYLRPFVASYEGDIDQLIINLKVKATDVADTYGQQGYVYIQSMFGDLLQYLNSQSPTPQTTQTVEGSIPSSTPGSSNPQPAVIDDDDLGYDIIDEVPDYLGSEEPLAASYLSRVRRRTNQGW